MWYDFLALLLCPIIVIVGGILADWWFSRPPKPGSSKDTGLDNARACVAIIDMTVTVNDQSAFCASFFDDIERGLGELGEFLHCDITDYAEADSTKE